MSILSRINELSPAQLAAQWVVIGALTFIAIFIIARTRAYEPKSVRGPVRASADRPVAPLAIATAVAFACWFGAQVIYVMPRTIEQSAIGAATQPIESTFSGRDIAVLSTIPPIVAVGAFVAVLFGMDRTWIARIGLTSQRLLRAPLIALISMLAAYPLIFWSFAGLEKLYELLRYEHPQEHEILKTMADHPAPLFRAALSFAAIVAAPLYEELFFRGGLQTLLGRAFGAQSSVGRTWLAIAVSSFLFAMIHSPWMAPAIFIVSLCFGYVYERTGNLWASICMHAMFNMVNTIYYMSLQPA